MTARPPPPTAHLIPALRCRLGAEPEVELTEEERTTLLTQGFLNLGQLISPEQCEEAKRRILAQVRSEKPSEWSVRTGDISLSNVLNKCNDDGLFDVAITHPKLLAAMRLTLGDSFRLFSLNVRGAGPGHGHQAFHTVCSRPSPPFALVLCDHWFDACADRIGARTATQ